MGVESRVGALGWDWEEWQALNYSHGLAQNQTTSWLMHSWSTFGAKMSHGQIRIHKTHITHHGPNLGEAITFPLIVYLSMRPTSKWHFVLGFPKFPKLGLSQLWGPITLCSDLWWRWGLKKSFSPCRELFNSMWHAIYTQTNLVNSRLLVVRSQTANLTPGLSFGHNLCFKYPNVNK